MKYNKKLNISFYSSLNTNTPGYRIGGAEAGSKRTVALLEKAGYNVFHISKPTKTNGALGYFVAALKSIWQTKAILSNHHIDLFYMIGFYEKNIFLEWLILRYVFNKKTPIIYEPKNGILINVFENGSNLYRNIFEKVIGLSNIVFCQGTQYVHFLEGQFNANCVYIPNYVMQKYLTDKPKMHRKRDTDTLIYFGRLSPRKNIDLIIKIHHILVKRGIQNQLILIGACESNYKAFLEEMIEERNIDHTLIRFYDAMPFDELKDFLMDADFFVFPSAEKKEGHSNALTEAMAFGTIPIASDAGFNREVINDERLIVSEYTADAYADRIEQIIHSGDMPFLSEKMMLRVRSHYSESIIAKRMISAIESLI